MPSIAWRITTRDHPSLLFCVGGNAKQYSSNLLSQNGSLNSSPEAAADEEVGTAAPHPRIGRNRRDRQGCERRDQLGAKDDDQAVCDARLADDFAEAQEHDDPEDRQRARREDATESAEFRWGGGFGGGLRHVGNQMGSSLGRWP